MSSIAKLAPATPEMDNPGKKKKIEQYEVEDAYRTINRAQEHMANPDLMKEVHKHAKKQLGVAKKTFNSLDELRQHASNFQKVNGAPTDEDQGV